MSICNSKIRFEEHLHHQYEMHIWIGMQGSREVIVLFHLVPSQHGSENNYA